MTSSKVRTLVRNGRVLTSSAQFEADLLIEDGKISTIATALESVQDVEDIIDASGKVVAPGGVDIHTHLGSPEVGTPTSDDFRSGQIAAAFGGTTSHVDFAIQDRGKSLHETLESWFEKARDRAYIDYGFHLAITDLNEERVSEMRDIVDRGVTSFKVFMAYKGRWMLDDAEILTVLRAAGASDGLVMLHCENGGAIATLVGETLDAGLAEPSWHGATRPPALEGEATHRAAVLAAVADAPAYIVHVTCAEAVEAIADARRNGWPVCGETCIQYLVLTEERLQQPGVEGAKYVCSPPLRSPEHADRLWRALRSGELQVVSTDHAPYWLQQKESGIASFDRIPNGLPTIEHRLPLLWEHGVREGRISASRWVQLVATNPSRLAGLYPRKGDIIPGADADLVIFDPDATERISARTHHMNTDYSVFEGMAVSGVPDTVLLRGQVIVSNREPVQTQEGQGRFLHRERLTKGGLL